MATPVVASSSSNKANSNSVTITAPTGITTGDLLVGSFSFGSFTSTETANIPSGWTSLQNGGQNKCKTAVFYKVAVLADESASNYTFTCSAADDIIGSILRITGAAAGNEITVSELDTLSSHSGGVSHTAASTPPTEESLLIMATGCLGLSISAVVTTSSYTSTPSLTWTEQMDDGYRDGASDGTSHAVATAPYTGTSEFTAYGYTRSESVDTADNGVLVIVSAPQDASGTTALHTATPTEFSGTAEVGTTGTTALEETSPILNSPSGNATAPTQWSNDSKPSTTWSNENKL